MKTGTIFMAAWMLYASETAPTKTGPRALPRMCCTITQTPEERHAVTAKLGAFKTSMLQDVEAGRALELDAIVTAVHEIGMRLGEPMPAIGALLGLTRVFGRVRGLYPDAAAAA